MKWMTVDLMVKRSLLEILSDDGAEKDKADDLGLGGVEEHSSNVTEKDDVHNTDSHTDRGTTCINRKAPKVA